jgi:tRNA A-37 threonylcarbamoyl transferase component Bud32
MEIVTLDDGRVRADAEFVVLLRELGMDTLRGVFAYDGDGFQRTHANRDNFHIVKELDGRTWELFLKRHRGFEVKEALKFLMAHAPFKTAGRREWDNILRLDGLGIQPARPAAFGERRFLCFELQSFVMTERIPGGVPLDDYILAHYSGELSAERLREKRALLWDLGSLMRRLHQAGFTHMDLYLNHFFVSETAEGDKELFLIDLQRVARRWAFKSRWLVKDLAALLYSARRLPLTLTDLGRVFMAYFDDSISRSERRLVRRALKRARALGRRRSRA